MINANKIYIYIFIILNHKKNEENPREIQTKAEREKK